ncbi:MAG: winged helix-turn-helix transcriptional regulator, partial [Nitrospirae bacterium]|nr:winged helix-turn-helix transcriptional regulator [Nitrospirota bacterium]
MASKLLCSIVEHKQNNPMKDIDSKRALQIMDEIAKGKSVTQRSLSKKLGIGLGMVNSYLNRLAQQGYIHIIQAERKRLHYLLTPTGIAEKSVLAYRYIERSYQTFAEARARIGDFLSNLEKEGVESVVLYRATVVAEIALMALQDGRLDLVAIVDDNGAGKRFLGYRVQPVDALRELEFDRILITT